MELVAPRLAPRARQGRRWSGDDVAREWRSTPDSGGRLLRSPRLAQGGLSELDSLVVRFADLGGERRFSLLWSQEAELASEERLRNHRELVAYGDPPRRAFRVRGDEIAYVSMLRDEPRRAARYLWLRLPSPAPVLDSVALVPKADAFLPGAGRTRVARAGETRAAFYTATPGGLRYSTPRRARAVLRFGVTSLHPDARLRCAVRVGDEGAPSTLLERDVREAGAAWHDFEVTLPEGGGDRATITLLAESDRDGDVAIWSNPTLFAPLPSRRPPSVILYVMDALRGDRVGTSATPGPAPFLEELAAAGVCFKSCYAQATWTKPSAASLLTSLYPDTHGVGAWSSMDALPESVPTLQGTLHAAGYVTAQFSANGFASSLSGLDRGFDYVFGPEAFPATGAGAAASKIRSDDINARLLPWLASHAGEPFFVYVHSVDTHPPWPGEGPAPQRYDAALAFNDRELRRLHEWLRGLGLMRETLLVVTSDHGEAFGEHGRSGHGLSAFQEEIHVPLVFSQPGRLAPRTVLAPVQSIDVMPTVLGLIAPGADRGRLQGRNLFSSRGSDREAAFTTPFVYPGDLAAADAPGAETRAVVEGPWKWIASGSAGALFDLARDPREQLDLAAVEPERARRLAGLLRAFVAEERLARRRFLAEHAGGGAAELPSEDALERLRALGYLK